MNTQTTNPILHMSVADIAAAIRAREITPVDVIDAHIERIMQVNPRINALVTPMYKQARKEAEAATRYIEQYGTDDLPPLFGVPITIKDSLPVEGVRFTAGSWYLRDNIAERNAPVVQRLLDAGAIILGKTNLPDMCWHMESVNPIFGRTNNPHNLKYSAGGSSGGEGAIIAAGGSPLGIGSDVAGSVRIPAALTGIVSLKPTGGRISNTGHMPPIAEATEDWLTIGPMARRVDDLALALELLSETPTRDYRDIKLQGRRCTVYIHNGLVPVRKSVAETVMMAAGSLHTTGLDVVRDDSLPLRSALLSFAALFEKHNGRLMREALGNGEPYSTVTELRANWRGDKHISFSVMYFTKLMEVFGRALRIVGFGNMQRLERLREQMLTTMQPGGVLLMPLLITPPPRHGWGYKVMFNPVYSLMFNALGFPAVIVPIRYNDKQLPMAVQIVAAPNEDEVALAVAAELEAAYGGWKMAQL